MKKKDVKLFIYDILESIEKIEFRELTQVQDTVIRRLEIIGEAVKKSSYEYFRVNLERKKLRKY